MNETNFRMMEAKIEKLENHHKMYKDNFDLIFLKLADQLASSKRIEHALMGNDMNDHKGLVSDFKDNEEQVTKLKDAVLTHKIYFLFISSVILGSGILNKLFKNIF